MGLLGNGGGVARELGMPDGLLGNEGWGCEGGV